MVGKMLPRFLYTFTNKTAFGKIIKDGYLKASKDGCGNIFDSVFLVDFQNLVKSWSQCTDDLYGENLITALLGQALKGEKTLCCLKIPTKLLSENKIFVRSQNNLIKFMSNDSGIKDISEIYSKGSKYKLYQRNNHAIEYMHRGNISLTDKVEYVGQVDAPDELVSFFKSMEKVPLEADDFAEIADGIAIKMLKSLFAGHPEAKALNV